jgi:hypothetical protein
MINWFRNAGSFDKPKKQVTPGATPVKPVKPKNVSPKKPKQVFKGPKTPGAYKKKLYIPKKFVMAAEEPMMSDEEMAAQLAGMEQAAPEIPEEEFEEEEVAPEAPQPTSADPVASGLGTIPGIVRITYRANPHCCAWCNALNGRTWTTVAAFTADKENIVKPHADHNHLAHPHCSCTLRVETSTGETYVVNSAGQPSQL